MSKVNVELTRDCGDGETSVNFFVIDGVNDHTRYSAYVRLRCVISDYLETDEGYQSIIDSGYGFCWGDAMNRIPNEFWKSRGIVLVDRVYSFLMEERILINVHNNEVLLKNYGW